MIWTIPGLPLFYLFILYVSHQFGHPFKMVEMEYVHSLPKNLGMCSLAMNLIFVASPRYFWDDVCNCMYIMDDMFVGENVLRSTGLDMARTTPEHSISMGDSAPLYHGRKKKTYNAA